MKVRLLSIIYFVGVALFTLDAISQVGNSNKPLVEQSYQEVEFENAPWGDEQLPCLLRVPSAFAICNATGCEFSLNQKAEIFPLSLSIQCIPIAAPTQYDNPTVDFAMRFIQIHTPLLKGFVVTYLDDSEGSRNDYRKIGFCISTKGNRRLCGESREKFNQQKLIFVQKTIESFVRDIQFAN